MGVFTPWELAKSTSQDWVFFFFYFCVYMYICTYTYVSEGGPKKLDFLKIVHLFLHASTPVTFKVLSI